jgi:hypothetical protein
MYLASAGLLILRHVHRLVDVSDQFLHQSLSLELASTREALEEYL